MSMFHDNMLKKYEVDIDRQRLKLWTVWEEGNPDQELTEIEFTGVEENFFCYGNYYCNMISDIEENKLSDFWENNRSYIMEKWRYGTPSFVEDSPTKQKIQNYLQKEKLRYFTIDATIGLSGWILARDVKVICNGEEINVFE